jgi:hypothetical protein
VTVPFDFSPRMWQFFYAGLEAMEPVRSPFGTLRHATLSAAGSIL